jgi:hypothetical protein
MAEPKLLIRDLHPPPRQKQSLPAHTDVPWRSTADHVAVLITNARRGFRRQNLKIEVAAGACRFVRLRREPCGRCTASGSEKVTHHDSTITETVATTGEGLGLRFVVSTSVLLCAGLSLDLGPPGLLGGGDTGPAFG